MKNDPVFRFVEQIKRITDGQEKMNLNQLVSVINAANYHADSGCSVNHKTLQHLKNNKWVSIRKSTLIALLNYFTELKHLPMIVVPGIFEALDRAKKVVFMLGAKPRPEERRKDVSHWDAQALAVLLPHCSVLDTKHVFDIRDVVWFSPAATGSISDTEWYADLERDESAIVSIGSPLASLSSEVMLARMFGVPEFQTPSTISSDKRLPFFFRLATAGYVRISKCVWPFRLSVAFLRS